VGNEGGRFITVNHLEFVVGHGISPDILNGIVKELS
jgi:hypothetical protein